MFVGLKIFQIVFFGVKRKSVVSGGFRYFCDIYEENTIEQFFVNHR